MTAKRHTLEELIGVATCRRMFVSRLPVGDLSPVLKPQSVFMLSEALAVAGSFQQGLGTC